MELDDLRRQWQAQPVTPAPALSATPAPNLIQQLRRNVWQEALSLLAAMGFMTYLGLTRVPGMLALVLLSVLGFGYFYVRQLAVLRRLGDNSQPVRSFLRVQLGALRELQHYYYWLNMVSFVAIMAVLAALAWPPLADQALRAPWVWAGGGLVFVVASGLLTHVFTRLHLRRFYGQYLARLEEAARELPAE